MILPWRQAAATPSRAIYSAMGLSLVGSIVLVYHSVHLASTQVIDSIDQHGDEPPLDYVDQRSQPVDVPAANNSQATFTNDSVHSFKTFNQTSTNSSEAQAQDDEQTSSTTPTYKPTAKIPQIPALELSISPDAQSLGVVAPEFISTTLDWWALGTEAWGNASIINANLAHPNLVTAAKGLDPFFLRIGGSQADEIIYNLPIINKGGGDASNHTFDANIEAECKKHPQKCLTSQRWDEALNFASSSGARIVFTLAYVRHTRGTANHRDNNDSSDWDSTNAKLFLEYTAKSEHAKLGTVYGFELGNELRHKGKIKNVTRIVNAYKELRQLVVGIWSRDEYKHYHRPKILGPASTGAGETSKLVAEVGPHLDFVSYHKYHGGGKQPELEQYVRHPSYYIHPMKVAGPGQAIIDYMANNSEKAQLWIGEGAMAYNSGRAGVTDSFVGSLWFANLLGAVAKTKPIAHSVYCRQALIGGYYEMISHETLIPNPDYWVAYVWKKIVGTKAIGPIHSPNRKDSVDISSSITFGCCKKPGRDSILVHTFCGKSDGDVVFVVINISDSKGIQLNVTIDSGKRTVYFLRPNKDGFASREVILNGKLLSIEDNTLPEISGVYRRGQLHIPPISIAFVVVHGTDVKECLSPVHS